MACLFDVKNKKKRETKILIILLDTFCETHLPILKAKKHIVFFIIIRIELNINDTIKVENAFLGLLYI